MTQRKTYTPDYLTHSKKYNHGEEEFVTIKNHHEPIIERAVWDMAQEELKRKSPCDEIKQKHSNRYPLSGKIFCASCGGHFVSRTKKRKDGSLCKAWRCLAAARHGKEKADSAGNKIGCNVAAQIRDEDFMLILQKVTETLEINKNAVIKGLAEVLKTVLASENEACTDRSEKSKKTDKLKDKINRLLDLYLSGDLTKEAYREKKAEYEKELAKLEKTLRDIKDSPRKYDVDAAVQDVCAYIKKILYATERDEIFYKNLVEKIVVHSREKLDVYFTRLPYKWSVVLNSASERAEACGSIKGTTYRYPSKDR